MLSTRDPVLSCFCQQDNIIICLQPITILMEASEFATDIRFRDIHKFYIEVAR